MENRKLIPTAENIGERLDRYLSNELDVPRSQVQIWIDSGLVAVSGGLKPKNYRLREDDEIEVAIPDPVPEEPVPQEIQLDIVYEDDDLLVVNKPKGMVVHPAVGNPDGTLVNALLAHCGGNLSTIGDKNRPGIVHRIDKDTSGLLIVAKNNEAHINLAAQIKDHSFTRIYEAVVFGRLKNDSGIIDAPIGRHPVHRQKMAVILNGEGSAKHAITHYEVIGRYDGYTHVRLKLETGRTHQIRVHMSYIGHPVAGDTVYYGGKQPKMLQGQCLHARTIGFEHPRDGRYMEFTSELPEYFTAFLNTLKD